MAIPARRVASNIRFSVFRWIKTVFATPGGYTVDYDEFFFDPDKIQEDGSVLARWVRLRVLSEGAGRKGEFLLQADCCGRIGDAPLGDELGATFFTMCDAFRQAMASHCIPVYQSFAGGSPTATGSYLLVQASGRRGYGFGCPQDERGPFVEAGLRRLIFTVRIIHREDGSGSPYFDA